MPTQRSWEGIERRGSTVQSAGFAPLIEAPGHRWSLDEKSRPGIAPSSDRHTSPSGTFSRRLLMEVLAYRLQSDAFGDLDKRRMTPGELLKYRKGYC
jgi:hypothetical protein